MKKPAAAVFVTACPMLAACLVGPRPALADPESTTTLQAMFDNAQPGGTVKLDRKV